MSDELLHLIGYLAWWIAISATSAAVICWALDWFCSRLIDAIWPPSPEEIANRTKKWSD